MSSESLEITVHAKPDFKDIDKEFTRVSKKAKKIFSFFGKFGKDEDDKNEGESKKTKKNKKKYKFEPASKYTGGSAYATKIGADGSDLDETGHGGFYNTLDKKISAAKDLLNKKKKKKENEESEDSDSLFKKDSVKQFQIQKSEIKIQNATIQTGNFPGGGGNESSGGGEVKGDTYSKLSAALPYIGAAFAVVGGVLKTVSAIGEQYHNAMQSQSQTIGATGGYVGGGGGYFSNSELAQANVLKGRVTGEDVFKKGNLIESNILQYAASQGKGIGEVVKELETIRKDSKNADLGYLRGGAKASGFNGLRQSEYITKLASLAENLRNKGFSGDISDYSRFSAGLKRTDSINMDPTRRMSLAEELSSKGRSGAFGGGIFGTLSLTEALKANGGDLLKSIRDSELNPGKYMSLALSGLDPNTRGLIHKMEGGSFSEMSSLKFGYEGFGKDRSSVHAGYNKGLELENRKKETFATDIGAEAAEIGYKLNTAMIDLFKENKNIMLGLTRSVSAIESKLIPVVSGSINTIGDGITMLCELVTPLVSSISKMVSLTSGNGMLVRTK
ncbi:hypothetical protein FH593_21000 (plasmid) [Leptospira interrogans]|uniref:Uncharacterized protein n=4 Tax=Leptospira interrogans TaxID=173 RepID=A0A0F6IBH9_LEPIR|nr:MULTISPECIES: hypothetical protein [Leptospira]EMJ35404.1 hypothetical protein LEP1GSC079_5232 [Leptospira interrogans str. FPW1039]EMN35982.1 hypothetical protein LEP1GSC084_1630 [Leptospira interrogans serovar Medanensis str. L0448]EMN95904.1 hypothetical protein LEP1GSC110_0778 [Leptospira interrogans serovar Medanensis str. UT053]EMN98408.1 hypothetical protein LEP1GSC112_0339 [Leptospira interrogans serovar Pomona str. UT364]KGE21714.1 hypothetical protein IQ65_22550 [Leptospira interr